MRDLGEREESQSFTRAKEGRVSVSEKEREANENWQKRDAQGSRDSEVADF